MSGNHYLQSKGITAKSSQHRENELRLCYTCKLTPRTCRFACSLLKWPATGRTLRTSGFSCCCKLAGGAFTNDPCQGQTSDIANDKANSTRKTLSIVVGRNSLTQSGIQGRLSYTNLTASSLLFCRFNYEQLVQRMSRGQQSTSQISPTIATLVTKHKTSTASHCRKPCAVCLTSWGIQDTFQQATSRQGLPHDRRPVRSCQMSRDEVTCANSRHKLSASTGREIDTENKRQAT